MTALLFIASDVFALSLTDDIGHPDQSSLSFRRPEDPAFSAWDEGSRVLKRLDPSLRAKSYAQDDNRRVIDDLGHPVTLQKPAMRIISLAPDITEILFAIGAGNKIVGTVDASDYPLAAKKITRVGSYSGLDLEKIVSLKPDLIINWNSAFIRQIQALRKLGIPIYTTRPRHLQDTAHSMLQFGELTDNTLQAKQQAQQFLRQLSQLKRVFAKKRKLNVYYQLGDYQLMTVNKSSWISEAIQNCGGQNVFANAMSLAFEVSIESLWQANPEIIINSTTSSTWHNKFNAWKNLIAVKNHQLYAINPDLLNRAGPRLLQGVRQLCELIDKARV